MELTRGSWKQAYERAKGALKRVKVEGERAAGTVITAVETVGTAFGMSYANQRWGKGEFKVLGLPADLVAGVGLHALAMLDGLGKYDEHGAAVANGLLASYGCRQGATMGTDAAQKDAAGPGYMSADARTGFIGANANMGPGWVDANANQNVRRAA